MDEPIGFIGVGRMGLPMATRLLEAGYRLVLHDARPGAIAPLVAKGARAAASPATVAASCRTVLLSLPTPPVVREVVLGANGVIEGAAVRTVIDLSTTGPRVTAAIAEGLAPKGITLVDSPVSGGVAGAVKGTLAVMVATDPARFADFQPLLAHLGRVFHVGAQPGMGQTMKLANNLLSATALAITSEALVMGVKAGLDPRVMCDVINVASGMNTASRDKFPRDVIPRTFSAGFATGLMYKDVRLCLEEGEALGVPMWVASAVRQLWFQANETLGPDSDFTAIAQLVERWAGVEVKAP